MSLESRVISPIQNCMENVESKIPEILSPEKVRILIPHDPEVAHYNAAVIQSKNDEILILLREVPLANIRAGIPDKGNLLIYKSTPEKVEKITQLDLSDPEVCNWEDARAFTSNKIQKSNEGIESEQVLIGLTAIRAKDNAPVAATVEGEITDGIFSIKQGSLHVYSDDEGKNVTPISLTESLFRRNGSKHSLEVIEHSEDCQNKLKIKKIVNFPKKSWCEWQIGTQAQFLPGGILPIHGVNRFTLGINPETNVEEFGYGYSLGLAQLDKDLNVIKVADNPIFTRESFKKILPMGKEMDSNKDVIYCCGYSIEGNVVKFVINIGDLMTVEVSKNLSEMQKSLDQSSPIKIEQTSKNAIIFQKSA